jgi:DNA invertase Pin-like site-specific DNA recombinase
MWLEAIMEIKVALYARVSTSDKGQDPEMQLRELREHCSRRGWTIVGEYVDVGVSGSKISRPQLDRMMADAAMGSFTAVAVWKFDRFARSVTHLLRALDTFAALKIDFVSLTEGIDTSTAIGRMVFTILGSVGELERSLICERVKAGLRNARAKGSRLGRPTVDVDMEHWAELKAAGVCHTRCAKLLGVDRGVLRRIERAA